MFWKMTTLQLKKGYIFAPNGDSAPFFGIKSDSSEPFYVNQGTLSP